MTAPAPEQDVPVVEEATPPEPRSEQKSEPGQDDDGRGGKEALKADVAKERRARQAKERELAEAQQRLREFEDAKLSEQEKVARDLAEAKAAVEAARREAARAQLDALKHRIAAEKGVPARLLAGQTEDELTASADEALKWRGEATPPPPKAPKPDQTVGPRGGQPISGADLYRQMHPNRTPATAGQ